MTHDTHFENTIGESNIRRGVVGKPKGAKNRPKPLYEGDGGTAGAQLRSYVERIEAVEQRKREVAEDSKEIYEELHGAGFDKKAVRAIVKERAQEPDKLSEHDAIVETYREALGMR